MDVLIGGKKWSRDQAEKTGEKQMSECNWQKGYVNTFNILLEPQQEVETRQK